MTTSGKVSGRNGLGRTWRAGFAASLLLTVSPVALHAETSNAELAKEIAELKAQIRAMKGAISETRSEARRTKVRTVVERAPAPVAALPPPPYAIPAGATPVFVTADKKMQYGAITITPGGFLAMESASRTRDQQADILSAFGNIPTNNLPQAHLAENRFTPRQSRAALLIEGAITPSLLVSGYGEFDFLGTATTSNNNQAYSYVPRIRNLYATIDSSDYGMHVLAGQNWSLVTLNSKGITPRNEVTPPQIDAAFIPGFEYARVPQIRLTKDFLDRRLWVSVDAEASQTVGLAGCNAITTNTGAAIAATSTLDATNISCLAVANGGSFGGAGLQTPLTYNKVPDFLGKVAYELKLADRDIHTEAFGVYRANLENVNYGVIPAVGAVAPAGSVGYPSSSNQTTNGYGVGAGLIVPVIPRRLDFQISGLIGRGMARYMSTNGMSDVAVTSNGQLKAVGDASALVGATIHATPSIDLYAFSGFEQQNRTFSGNGAGFVGLGAPGGINNTGCNVEGGTCQGATHRVFQITGGFWDKVYKGSFGEVRAGVQYSYTQRFLFGGTANANGVATALAPFTSARANENTILTSLRYYPFQ